jgi:hypothetical protein
VWDSFGESKVAYLPHALLQEYVGRLEIAVDDVEGSEVLTALRDLVGNGAPFDAIDAFGVLF